MGDQSLNKRNTETFIMDDVKKNKSEINWLHLSCEIWIEILSLVI